MSVEPTLDPTTPPELVPGLRDQILEGFVEVAEAALNPWYDFSGTAQEVKVRAAFSRQEVRYPLLNVLVRMGELRPSAIGDVLGPGHLGAAQRTAVVECRCITQGASERLQLADYIQSTLWFGVNSYNVRYKMMLYYRGIDLLGFSGETLRDIPLDQDKPHGPAVYELTFGAQVRTEVRGVRVTNRFGKVLVVPTISTHGAPLPAAASSPKPTG